MILYLDAKTKVPDLVIDYIEVKLQDGRTISLNWDESDISRTEDGFSARYKGVYFDDAYANGHLEELKGLQITDVGLYSDIPDIPLNLTIDGLEFLDFDEELVVDHPFVYRESFSKDPLEHMTLANKTWDELRQAGFYSGGWDPKTGAIAILQADNGRSKYVGRLDSSTLEISWLDQTKEAEPPMGTRKIKVYDMEAFLREENLEPFRYNKVAVFEGPKGVVVAEHEAVHQRLEHTDDTLVIPANRPHEPGKSWIMPQFEVTLSADTLMTAPYTEMSMEDFFDRRTYNPRCETNFSILLNSLREIGFDLHGYFIEQHPTLGSQIRSASDRKPAEKNTSPKKDRDFSPDL